jgi:pimeloyl-ACP methyl ester carboxylesterase
MSGFHERSPDEPHHDLGSRAADTRTPVRSLNRARIIKVARIVVLAYLGTIAVLFSIQTRLIFPGANTQGQAGADVRPRDGTELVRIKTKQDDAIVALYGPAVLPNGRPDPRPADRPTMIFFYGNAMCLNYAADQLEELRRLGINVLIPEYIGYGMSSGKASEKGCQATALAAYDYLITARKVDPKRIISAGWSLGGAVAIDLASERPLGGLIAFSSFTSAVELGRRTFPFVPVSLLLRHRFDNIHKIAKITCPTLIGHGRRDRTIPFAMGEELAANAGGPVTTLWIDRAEHNDFFDVGGVRIDQAIAEFAARLNQGAR